jgi:hypothetical protein
MAVPWEGMARPVGHTPYIPRYIGTYENCLPEGRNGMDWTYICGQYYCGMYMQAEHIPDNSATDIDE